MYWRVQFPPGWLWNKHLYADLRITYLHTFATFILHLQHLLAYICNIYLHTYATITCIHLQHLLAYICNIYLHTSATFMRIHLQHLCAYICNIYAHTFATFMRIHNIQLCAKHTCEIKEFWPFILQTAEPSMAMENFPHGFLGSFL